MMMSSRVKRKKIVQVSNFLCNQEFACTYFQERFINKKPLLGKKQDGPYN